MKNDGKNFEQLIETIYKKLDKTSTITRDDKIYGYKSEQLRQIDISIKTKIGIHEILIIVQAKDYNDPVDINVIGEFSAVIEDVRASKGILISAKGFTKGAIKLAKSFGIETLTGHDSKNPRWTLKINVPVILKTYIGNFNLDFKFCSNDDYIERVKKTNRQIQMPNDFRFQFTSGSRERIIVPIDDFRELYLSNRLVADGAEHTINFPSNIELIMEKGLYLPAKDLTIKYILTKKSYYKYFELTEFQGLINRMTTEINPSHFKLVANEFTIENNKVTDRKEFSFEKWNEFKGPNELINPFKINLYHFPQLKQNGSIKVNKEKNYR